MRHARIKPDYEDTWHHCYNFVEVPGLDTPDFEQTAAT